LPNGFLPGQFPPPSSGELIAAQTYFLTLFQREEVDDPAARLIVRRALAAAGL